MSEEHTPNLLTVEDEYSKFYKDQLFLAAQDDYANFSGKFTRFEQHVARKVMIAYKSGKTFGLEPDWLESIDGESHVFRAANIRNFMRGKDSQHAIWAVFDIYIKYTNPIIARAFTLEGYLSRLGFSLSEFIQPVPNAPVPNLKASGFYSLDVNEDLSIYLDIQHLKNRRYGLVHFAQAYSSDYKQSIDTQTVKLTDHRTRANKGVIIPQLDNDLLVIREVETADVSFAFLRTSGDHIRFHHITLDGTVQELILKPDHFPEMQQTLRAAEFDQTGENS